MSSHIDEEIERAKVEHTKRLATLRKKKKDQEERIDRELIRLMKKHDPETYNRWREETVRHMEKRRSERARKASQVEAQSAPVEQVQQPYQHSSF